MIRRIALAVLMLWATAPGPAPAAEKPLFSILYLSRAEDPAYQQRRSYAGLALRDMVSPVDGARAALRESRMRGRALGMRFELEELELAPSEVPGTDAVEAVRAAGPRAVLLDLPLDGLEAVVAALGGRDDLILFNIRHPDDGLRAQGCAPALLHTLPSRAMLTDALAQYLAARNWRRVLVLAGKDAQSAATAAAFARSAAKFGLRIAGARAFELTNDPRRRERSNIALLTGGAEHDVVFLADEIGEFGRYVPYATYAPRPVVGTEGLRPLTWHWTWERYGAPQLNQRFERRIGRHMQAEDWAAWAAVRAVVEAISRTRSTDIAALRAFMMGDEFSLDLYKGAPGSFRPWSGQLRQPILLGVHNAVIERAPLDEFLHQTNTLDTLGFDAPEANCPRR
jgi:ABC transporter substrate binding protein (PQQ-dependent alcohol dehydrogenase system)